MAKTVKTDIGNEKTAPEEFRVEFVSTLGGRVPFQEFLDTLSIEERAEVLAMIEEFRRLRTQTASIPESISKALSDGIFELRTRHRNRSSRSLYFYMSEKKIVFTHGFMKKTRTTPREEIAKAKDYRSQYIQRKGAPDNETR